MAHGPRGVNDTERGLARTATDSTSTIACCVMAPSEAWSTIWYFLGSWAPETGSLKVTTTSELLSELAPRTRGGSSPPPADVPVYKNVADGPSTRSLPLASVTP